MTAADKLLARMRASPGDDWVISDVQKLCRRHHVMVRKAGQGGSHVTLSFSRLPDILTIPARKPIKIIYIARFVLFIDAVVGATP